MHPHSTLVLVLIFTVTGLRPVQAEDGVDYLTQIKPLLESKCYSCHSALRQEGGLRLETRSLMQTGGDSGPALTTNQDSLLLERISADDDSRMPPPDEGAALRPQEIELVRRWILQGAKAPEETVPVAPSRHWAFQRIERPELPVDGEHQNPIDALLSAKRLEAGLQSQPRAERSLLIRRLYLDLIGLPPSVEQLHDERRVDQIVDELLASPHYGERWGRHWMDVWRYSDWYGLGAQLRNSQKHIWRWRDWIVGSLNKDKGYDRMIQEMLAGDELDPADPESVAGTGFLARNYYLFNRTTWLDSTIEHTGKAFFGLTLNCAKCHDHKYDPISQVDYYSFRAIFEPHQVRLDPVPGTTDFEKDGLPRVFDDHLDAETWLHRKGDPKNPDKELQITARVPELFLTYQPEVRPVQLPTVAYDPLARDYVQQNYLQAVRQKVDGARLELQTAEQKLARLVKDAPRAQPDAAATAFEFRDNFDAPDAESWDIVGSWSFNDGRLLRTTSTRDAEYVRFRKPLPKDFEVVCRYTTTGGATYKSVTFRFDESDDRQYANYVYTSAHQPGPKVQVAFQRNGASSYPADGRRSMPIRIGEQYELKFAVRDKLVNVWLNGEFVLAYQLPDRPASGRLSLSGFDATVAFEDIMIRSLPVGYELAAAGNVPAETPKDAAGAVELAKAKLLAAEAELAATQAVLDAENNRLAAAGSDESKQKSVQAARQQALALKASAEYEKLVAGTEQKKLSAAQKKLTEAEQKLASAAKGEYARIRVAKKALEGPADKEANHPLSYAPVSSGRRLALAQWATSRDNPLTARVAVNHVWLRHFGTPLVESVFDFGLRSRQPLHQDVLDFLSAEFMASGWSFKHLHRLIVTSETWQLTSSTLNAHAETLAKDPANTFYWRMNARRMEAQVVRDSVLHLAGTLDLQLGGPSLDVGNGSNRRSIYFKHSRDQHDKFLSMFDDADLLQCYRRSESIVPQQALAMANSQLSMLNASRIADRVKSAVPREDLGKFVAVAFELIIGREAAADELRACVDYCAELKNLVSRDNAPAEADVEMQIRTRLIHSLLNLNDFVTIR